MALKVAFEGLPGAGKTTVIRMMVEELREKGFNVEVVDIETVGHAPVLRPVTRAFPFGHPARILLFWALRFQQYEVMKGLSDKTDIVFLDRYWGSTLAYDFYGHGLRREVFDWIGERIEQPDITLFFDVPLEVVRKRKTARTMSDTRFARRVEQGYRKLATAMSWIRVDTTVSPEEVKENCLRLISLKL